MEIIFGILIGLFVLMLLVVVHEFGHFIMARKSGVEVKEFAICFPPRAIAWQKIDGKWRKLKRSEWEKPPGKGTVVSLNWLPIGGFCQMKGDGDADPVPHGFGRASFWGKTKILFGGIVANLIIAAGILTVLAWTGMPHFIPGQFHIPSDTNISAAPVIIGTIEPDSPAQKAGLMPNDQIKTLQIQKCVAEDCLPVVDETVQVITPQDITNFNSKFADQQIKLTFIRDNREEQTLIQLNPAGGDYILGITMNQASQPLYRSTWSAPIVGVATTAQLTGETFRSVGEMIGNLIGGVAMQVNFDNTVREEGAAHIEKAGQSVSGPVGIVGIIFPAFAQSGLTNLAFLAAIISISLACMNILPIPALDGGRWLLIAFYRLRNKKLTREVEEKIVSRAFLVLIGLIILITVLDITRFFK